MSTSNERTPAFIDEKDVTTDWIEMVFDDYNCTCGGHKDRSYVGFVNECAVLARIHNNSLWWNIMPEQYTEDKVQETYSILLERLKEYDSSDDSTGLYCEYWDRLKHDGCLVQEFYFKDND